jgi:hypothetical protein
MTDELIDRRSRESVWKRLTRLFRSGPVVRHKIASGEKFQEPQGTASAYKKELSHLYVHALASYGQYERMCLSFDYKGIAVPGVERYISLYEAAKKYPNGEKFLVYAYDHKKKKIVPAWAHHPRSSGFKETVKVTFNDGSSLVCTPDHPCMLRDGTYLDAEKLEPGQSMMPFYRRQFNGVAEDGKKFSGYSSIYTMEKQKSWKGWEPEHRLITEWFNGRDVQKSIEHVHHKDHNPENNDPSNLEIIDAKKHLSEHGKQAKEQWNNPDIRKKTCESIQRAWDNDDGSRRAIIAESNTKFKTRSDVTFDAICNSSIRNNHDVKLVLSDLNCGMQALMRRIRGKGFDVGNSWNEFVKQKFNIELPKPDRSSFASYWKGKHRSAEDRLHKTKQYREVRNHKVVSVERNGIIEVGDLTVDGYENFATDTIIVHNSRYSDYSEMEFCIHGQSLVFLPDENTFVTIEELSKRENKSFNIISWDHSTRKFVKTKASNPHFTRNDNALNIILCNGKNIIVSSEHRLMLNDGSYRKACCLKKDDVLMSPKCQDAEESDAPHEFSDLQRHKFALLLCLAEDIGFELFKICEHLKTTIEEIEFTISCWGFSSWEQFVFAYDSNKEMLIADGGVAIDRIEDFGNVDLYDLSVEGFKNFCLDSVISHNTPEIASALNIWSDETTTHNEKNHMLEVVSKNAEIKQILETLFFDVLNIEFNLWSWVRNLVKYGDFLLFVDASESTGILNLLPIPINEIEREEGFDKNDPFAVRFRWTTQGNRILQNWQVIHFRLLGNDNFLPYGQSIIEPARRIWRQLILIEDAMMVYRIVRSPERRVFYIDVGNTAPKDADQFMEKIKNKLRRNQIVDPTSGRVDLRYNPLPIRSNTCVPLLDGRNLTIKQLAEEYEAGKENWVYSIQDETKRLVPGKVKWCGKNYTCDKLHRVWLDDGSYVDTAPEHPFVMRDGSSKRADELRSGDSLLSLYRDLNNKGYERIIEPDGTQTSTHVMVARDVYKRKWDNEDRPEHVGFSSFKNYMLTHSAPLNHQVAKVEILENVSDDVYCMTVVGPFNEEDRHNFSVIGNGSHEICKSFILLKNSVDEDYFIPIRGDKSSKIETLPGGQFTGDIDDVQYIQNKMFAALQVPKAYLGYEGDIGSKATLAQQDVRFARSVERVQKIVVAELSKIAIIHLFLMGFDGDALADFELKLATASTVAEQQKLELWRQRFEIAAQATEGVLDRETIYRTIFSMSDDEIEKVREGKKFDKLEDLTLENMQAPGEEPSGEENLPGEEELPTTLGGETGEEKPEAPAEEPVKPEGKVIHRPVINEKKKKLFKRSIVEKRNKGSEGNDSTIAVDKGKNLFSTGEDQYELAFGTDKQTASDPYDTRASRRLVTRPFSEDTEIEDIEDALKEAESMLNDLEKV